MRDLDDIKPERPDQGFQFPGAFEITAIGRAEADLERRVPEILAGLGLNVILGSLRSRPSRDATAATPRSPGRATTCRSRPTPP